MDKNASWLAVGVTWVIKMTLVVVLIPCFLAGLALTIVLSPAILTFCVLYMFTMCFMRFYRIASINIAYVVSSKI